MTQQIVKSDILSLTDSEISAVCMDKLKFMPYQCGQVSAWLKKGVFDFSKMSDLSSRNRESLVQIFRFGKIVPEVVLESKIDGTRKYLFRLDGGDAIESVLMRYKHGNSVCVSTQAGCRMGCSFCASGIAGLSRNLSPSEMFLQVRCIEDDTGERVSNVVMMGIGEPLDNFDASVRFMELLNSRMGIGYRHISLSTSGLCDKILLLAEKKLPITLSVSIHAPNDSIRGQIMPVNKKWGVDELISVCRRYVKITGRRISFEYILLNGVNDSRQCALELAGKLSGMLCHVNLIPVNSVAESGYREPQKTIAAEFAAILERHGIAATVRRRCGADINASCGQLRKSNSPAGNRL